MHKTKLTTRQTLLKQAQEGKLEIDYFEKQFDAIQSQQHHREKSKLKQTLFSALALALRFHLKHNNKKNIALFAKKFGKRFLQSNKISIMLHNLLVKHPNLSPPALYHLLQNLDTNIAKKLLLKKDHHGALLLHLAAKSGNSNLLALIINLLKNDASIASKMVTNKGRLALDYANKNKHKYQQTGIISRLKKLTFQNNLIPPTKRIKIDDVFNNFDKEIEIQTAYKIIRAYKAVNDIRAKIKFSETHPYTNSLPENTKDLISTRIDMLRTSVYPERFMKNPKYAYENILYSKVANCGEYSLLIAYELRDLGKVEVMTMNPGDHIFVVVDRPNDSLDFKDWDDRTLIIDAFVGDVFPATEIPKKLSYYRCINDAPKGSKPKYFSILGPINQNYHLSEPFTLTCGPTPSLNKS